jgi:hypothetical protein
MEISSLSRTTYVPSADTEKMDAAPGLASHTRRLQASFQAIQTTNIRAHVSHCLTIPPLSTMAGLIRPQHLLDMGMVAKHQRTATPKHPTISGLAPNAAHRIATGVISAQSAAVAGANPTPTATPATPVHQLHTTTRPGTWYNLSQPTIPSVLVRLLTVTGDVLTVEVRMAR